MDTNYKLRHLFTVIAIACCSATTAGCAQSDAWQKHTESGNAALEQGNYEEAKTEFSLALKEAEKPPLPEPQAALTQTQDMQLTASLDSLAEVYCRQGNYAEAEALYKRVVAIRAKGHNGFVPQALTNLAEVYRAQRRFAEAAPLLRRALNMDESTAGPQSPALALDLNNLGVLLTEQGKNSEAEPLYKHELSIEEAPSGPFPPELAPNLKTLSNLYRERGKFAETEKSLKSSLKSTEDVEGRNHPDVSLRLDLLAALYVAQEQYDKAEPLLKRSLITTENLLGADHNGIQSSPQQVLAETTKGDTNPLVAIRLDNLAQVYCAQGKYDKAEPLLKRSLAITQNTLGATHPQLASTLEIYADLLRKTNRIAEAEEMEAKAKSILTPQT